MLISGPSLLWPVHVFRQIWTCQKEQYDSWILFQFAKLQKREYMGNL